MAEPDEILRSLQKRGPRTNDEEFAIAAAWASLVQSPEYRVTIQAEAATSLAAALQQTADPRVNGEALAMARAECAVWDRINRWALTKPEQYRVMQEARAQAMTADKPESPDDYVGEKLPDQWYENRP